MSRRKMKDSTNNSS